MKHKIKVLEQGSVELPGQRQSPSVAMQLIDSIFLEGAVTLEHIRKELLGHDLEPDAQNRDLRLFFALSWGISSSPSICPLIPDKLDSQLSQVRQLFALPESRGVYARRIANRT